jgi:hypothetical protein
MAGLSEAPDPGDRPLAPHAGWATSRDSAVAFLRRPFGAVALALLLSAVTLPITMAGITMVESMAEYTEPTGLLLFEVALCAVVCASIAGAGLARRLPVRWSTARFVAAVFVAWPVAIMALPVLPALQGQRMDIGRFCIDSCSPLIESNAVTSGLEAYLQSLVGAVLFTPVLLIVGVAVIVAAVIGRTHPRVRPVTMILLAALLATVNGFSILNAPVPFAVLVGGAAAWALLLRQVERPEAVSTTPGPPVPA